MSLGSAFQIHKAAEVKGHFSTQCAHPEPPVQIPAWISSGCWLQQQEGTLQNGRKTNDRLCLYESSASLWTKIYSCLLRRGICFYSGQFEPAVCLNELQLPLQTSRKPNVLHSLSSLACFPPPLQVIVRTLQSFTMLNDPGMIDLWETLLRFAAS